MVIRLQSLGGDVERVARLESEIASRRGVIVGGLANELEAPARVGLIDLHCAGRQWPVTKRSLASTLDCVPHLDGNTIRLGRLADPAAIRQYAGDDQLLRDRRWAAWKESGGDRSARLNGEPSGQLIDMRLPDGLLFGHSAYRIRSGDASPPDCEECGRRSLRFPGLADRSRHELHFGAVGAQRR